MKCLITGDPLSGLKATTDTSLRIAHELLKRGHSVDWCDTAQNVGAKAEALKVSSLQEIHFFQAPAIKNAATVSAANYDLIMHRKDPPVDPAYKNFHAAFLKLPTKVWQLNHPQALLKYREHLLPQDFAAESWPTREVHSMEEVEASYNEWSKKIVLKLDNEGRGIGVRFILSDTDFYDFAREKPEFPRVAQPFVPGVPEDGDLRVLCFNGTILGYFVRIPRHGSLLANFYQGGQAAYRDLTTREKAASEKISKELVSKDIYFTGIDFLAGKVSEINFTSPTGFAQYETLTQKKPAEKLVDFLEQTLHTRT